jgi:Flp pilus assembly pilin Flp
MSNKKSWRGGQVLLEYGVILVLVVSAIMAMQLYLQRGLQGRYKAATDRLVREVHRAKGEADLYVHYDPYYHISDITTEDSSQITSSYSPEGRSTTVIEDKTSRQGMRLELPYSD